MQTGLVAADVSPRLTPDSAADLRPQLHTRSGEDRVNAELQTERSVQNAARKYGYFFVKTRLASSRASLEPMSYQMPGTRQV